MKALPLLLMLAASSVAAQTPTVHIDAPAGGWTTKRIATVKGTVENAKDLGVLNVNGVERPLPLKGGRFEATFALGRGDNAIEVVAPAKDGTSPDGRAQLLVHARVPKVDLQVILFWDTDKTDVDLHVKQPSGEVVYYGHRVGENGGRLDRDDVDGYGPEIFSLAAADSGVYEVMAHYFGDRGTGQTTATVFVIAREGTDEERRWRYEVPLIRTGEKAVLARFDLPPPGQAFKKAGTTGAGTTGALSHEKDSPIPSTPSP